MPTRAQRHPTKLLTCPEREAGGRRPSNEVLTGGLFSLAGGVGDHELSKKRGRNAGRIVMSTTYLMSKQ